MLSLWRPRNPIYLYRQLTASLLIALTLLTLFNVPNADASGLASISISDASLVEGDSGEVNMDFTVTRTGDLSSTVVVSYTTVDGSAKAGVDYAAQSGELTIPAGSATAVISVPVYGDTIGEGDRAFSVQLTGVINTYDPAVSFSSAQSLITDFGQIFAATADFNGDGKLDLATVNYLGGAVGVLLNTTSPGASTSTFAEIVRFPVGSALRSVAVEDFNGDSKPDLALANDSARAVSVLLNMTAPGASTPTFTAKTDIAAGDHPNAVAVGDFNGDGKIDLTSANGYSNNISVLLNTTPPGASTPTFATKVDFATGSNPTVVAAGDFNDDGKLDLATGNQYSTNISVLLNTTTPGADTPAFATKIDLATGNSPASITVGDLNGDGKLDLVSAISTANSISVLLNTTPPGATTPTFAAEVEFATGDFPRSVAVGDMNGDGKLDLSSANSSASTVSVLLNMTPPGATTPTFVAKVEFATGAQPCSVAVGDLNGDGKPDLASANYNSSNVSVLLNATPADANLPTFSTNTDFSPGLMPSDVAAADFNRDGKLDLAVANLNSSTISVLLNTTPPGADTPTFSAKVDFTTGIDPTAIAVGNFNGDGLLDLVVANYTTGTISVLLNTTPPGADTPSFTAKVDFATGFAPNSVVVGDFNRDALPDVAVANISSNNVSVLLNTTTPGATTPTFAAKVDFATGSAPNSVTVGDFNGDGLLDLASANSSSGNISVLLNTTSPGASTPTFAAKVDFTTGYYPNSLMVGDFNGDGLLDLVSTNNDVDIISVLLNETTPGATTPSFAGSVNFATGNRPVSVAVGDFNADGLLDLASADLGSAAISVLFNATQLTTGPLDFSSQQSFAVSAAQLSVAVGDFNGDGLLDLAAATDSYNKISVLLNLDVNFTTSSAKGTIIDNEPINMYLPIIHR